MALTATAGSGLRGPTARFVPGPADRVDHAGGRIRARAPRADDGPQEPVPDAGRLPPRAAGWRPLDARQHPDPGRGSRDVRHARLADRPDGQALRRLRPCTPRASTDEGPVLNYPCDGGTGASRNDSTALANSGDANAL